MNLNPFFKSVLEQDHAAVVLCDLSHTILYMNPAAVRQYENYGGALLVGKNLCGCHNPASVKRIEQVLAWFSEAPEHNQIYIHHSEKKNRDDYMIALRDEDGTLIVYYEKHEYRDPETEPVYAFC